MTEDFTAAGQGYPWTGKPDPDVELVRELVHDGDCGSKWGRECDCGGDVYDDALSRISSRLEEPKAYVHRDRYEALESRLEELREVRDWYRQRYDAGMTTEEAVAAEEKLVRLRAIEEAARNAAPCLTMEETPGVYLCVACRTIIGSRTAGVVPHEEGCEAEALHQALKGRG